MNDIDRNKLRNKMSDQIQIDDQVVYVPEGVRATVTGYVWKQEIGGLPSIVAYELSCGITASRSALERMSEVL